jgi:hypothetical protein
MVTVESGLLREVSGEGTDGKAAGKGVRRYEQQRNINKQQRNIRKQQIQDLCRVNG